MVIFSHSFPLSGSKFEPYVWLTHFQSLGTLGVEIFFVLSGFLITASWDKSRRPLDFAIKRIRRITPGLLVANLITLIVLGAVFYRSQFLSFLTGAQAWHYLAGNTLLTHITFNVGRAFVDNPYAGAVNGSLWSLPYEVSMYCLVGLAGILGVIRFRLLAVGAVGILFGALIHGSALQNLLPMINLDASLWLPLALYFSIGALFYLYKDHVVLSPYFACFALFLYIAGWRSDSTQVLSLLCVPYLVMWFSFTDLKPLMRFQGISDLSYGLYIYAFPVQQLLMHFLGKRVAPMALFALALPVTLALADMSWRYIERPALTLGPPSRFLIWQKKTVSQKSGNSAIAAT